MTMLEMETLQAAAERKRLFGAYPAEVVRIDDPDQQGRVRVKLPWSPDAGGGYEAWARLAVPMAGNDRGTWLVPDVGDEVLVLFEAGDPRRPYVVGALWNGRDAPPESMDGGGRNYVKSLVSRQGIRITLDDHEGQEKLTLKTPQVITIDDGGRSVEIKDATGHTIKLDATSITLDASGTTLTLRPGQLQISAAMVTVDAGMSKFSGVVQCDTLMTNSVVSSSYTPGAGNIW
jgi:uncharacterized protein involved in type VI secretion and phage assembly